MSNLRARAAELDAADPLAGYRDRFVGSETELVYFDGNSLGRPLRATAERLSAFVAGDWGGRLIRGWDEQWYDAPLALGDEIGRICVGAAPGQVAVGESTTVWLYKLIYAGVAGQRARDPRRDEIVVAVDDFPTDRYLVEGIAADLGCRVVWLDAGTTAGVTGELLAPVLGDRTALVVLSHVTYRSGFMADGPGLTRQIQQAGALVLWDFSHSVGSVEVDLDGWGADLAAGCTYKYLNGGPGSPAFGYVAARHQGELRQPIQGWMGHANPFLMGPGYHPSDGMRRFLSGTPPITGMLGMRDMLALIDEVGMPAVRRKSVALTAFACELTSELLPEVEIASPADPESRGGHITLRHPAMQAVNAALWQRDVLPDYRDPGGLRIGLSPLSTSFDELWRGMQAVREEFARVTG